MSLLLLVFVVVVGELFLVGDQSRFDAGLLEELGYGRLDVEAAAELALFDSGVKLLGSPSEFREDLL